MEIKRLRACIYPVYRGCLMHGALELVRLARIYIKRRLNGVNGWGRDPVQGVGDRPLSLSNKTGNKERKAQVPLGYAVLPDVYNPSHYGRHWGATKRQIAPIIWSSQIIFFFSLFSPFLGEALICFPSCILYNRPSWMSGRPSILICIIAPSLSAACIIIVCARCQRWVVYYGLEYYTQQQQQQHWSAYLVGSISFANLLWIRVLCSPELFDYIVSSNACEREIQQADGQEGKKICKVAKRWYGSKRQLPPANVTHISIDKNFHLSYGRQSRERRTSEMSKGRASNRASGTVGQAPSIDRKEYIRSYIYPTHIEQS